MNIVKMKTTESKMIVDECKFLDTSLPETFREEWTKRAWSRPYEYGAVIDALKGKQYETCHNTACGERNVHLAFADELTKHVASVTNSDRFASSKFPNYIQYDLTREHSQKYDVVLCVSVLEHLPASVQKKATMNLVNQVKPGGKLILTFDYPRVNVSLIEDLFDITPTMTDDLLNGATSKWPMDRYRNLSVIYFEATKEK